MTNSDIPLYKLEDYLIDIFPDNNRDESGFSARAYKPHHEQWFLLDCWHPTKEGALEQAMAEVRDWMREAFVVETFKPVIEQLEVLGYTFSEILNGLAELVDLAELVYCQDSCLSDVCKYLEEASAAAANFSQQSLLTRAR